MTMKYTLGANELSSKSYNLWKSILAEFIGIFILNFFACAACTQSNGDLTLISLAFGLSVFMAAMVSAITTHHNWSW
jgi:aquaporin rerated protein, invertebrate